MFESGRTARLVSADVITSNKVMRRLKFIYYTYNITVTEPTLYITYIFKVFIRVILYVIDVQDKNVLFRILLG